MLLASGACRPTTTNRKRKVKVILRILAYLYFLKGSRLRDNRSLNQELTRAAFDIFQKNWYSFWFCSEAVASFSYASSESGSTKLPLSASHSRP